MKMNKKGMFEDITGMAKGIAVVAILLVVCFLIIAQARTQASAAESKNWSTDKNSCRFSATCNATTTLRDAVATIPGWVPLLVIVVIGAIILGALKMFS